MCFYQATFDKVTTFDQVTFDKVTLDQVTFDQETLDKVTFYQVTFYQVTFYQVTLDKETLDKMTFDRHWDYVTFSADKSWSSELTEKLSSHAGDHVHRRWGNLEQLIDKIH